MNNEIFLDTNILIYLLQGDKDLQGIVGNKLWYVSFISEIEIMLKPDISKQDEKAISALLNDCFTIEMNANVKQLAIQYGRKYKLKVADSIILASSIYSGKPFITADKTFKKIPESEGQVLIYEI